MDYEESYKEAKKRVKKALLRCRNLSTETNLAVAHALDYVFGETNASEDERIRKELIEFLENEELTTPDDFDKMVFGEWIAYLEKQKEPNPSTPIEQEPVEKQDYSGLTKLERAIHRGFLCAGIENVPVEIIKETAQECRLVQMKSAEWSAEDEHQIEVACSFLKDFADKGYENAVCCIDWLKSLRPQPHWKPSEEQLDALKESSTSWMNYYMENCKHLKSLYNDLKKL